MNKKEFIPLSAAFLISYTAMGISYFPIPYSSLSLPNSLFDTGLLLMSIAAMALCVRGAGFMGTAATLGMSASSVVMTRILLDTMRDPSTHNLWPFEMAIAVFIGFAIAGFSAMLGVLIRKTFMLDAEKHQNGGD